LPDSNPSNLTGAALIADRFLLSPERGGLAVDVPQEPPAKGERRQ
jgi:hypothetical protein